MYSYPILLFTEKDRLAAAKGGPPKALKTTRKAEGNSTTVSVLTPLPRCSKDSRCWEALNFRSGCQAPKHPTSRFGRALGEGQVGLSDVAWKSIPSLSLEVILGTWSQGYQCETSERRAISSQTDVCQEFPFISCSYSLIQKEKKRSSLSLT